MSDCRGVKIGRLIAQHGCVHHSHWATVFTQPILELLEKGFYEIDEDGIVSTEGGFNLVIDGLRIEILVCRD